MHIGRQFVRWVSTTFGHTPTRPVQPRSQQPARSPSAVAGTSPVSEPERILIHHASQYQSLVQKSSQIMGTGKIPAFLALQPQSLQQAHYNVGKIKRNNKSAIQQRTAQEYITLSRELRTYICASKPFQTTYPDIGNKTGQAKRDGFAQERSHFVEAIETLATAHGFSRESIAPFINIAVNAYKHINNGEGFGKLLIGSLQIPVPPHSKNPLEFNEFFSSLEAPLTRIKLLLDVIDIDPPHQHV